MKLAGILVTLALTACGDDDGGMNGGPDAPADPDAAPRIDAGPPDAAAAPDVYVSAPDLILIPEWMEASVRFDTININSTSCELEEACVTGEGQRTVLKFDTWSYNQGDADLLVGTPDPASPVWQYSECHDHFHFLGFAVYELLSAEGVIASGHKQAFCLLDLCDFEPDINDCASGNGKFTCSYQGISAGWADIYSSDLPCQWVDVTDVPPGTYTLRVSLNPERNLYERDYDNNIFEIPVTIE